MAKVKAELNDAKRLRETFEILVIICKLFYSLNYQVSKVEFAIELFAKDPFHNIVQFEAKDVIPCAARNLHRIIMLQLHVQNNFMRC